MAYVDGFEHDIFLSYARVDDQTAADGGAGWVSAFEKHLQVALDRRVGRIGVVRIWRDLRRIQGHQLFDRTIADAVNASAVFVGLTSRGYLASDYCRDEIACFNRRVSGDALGRAVGDQLRIVNVLLTNLEPREWPEEYAGTSGFPFHDAESGGRRGEPSEPDGDLFKNQLRALADALYELLEALQRAARPAAAARPRPTVFLAEVPDTLRLHRKRVIEDLKRQEVDVLADVPPPFAESDHDRRVIEALGRADLSVHLLDAVAGREIDGREDQTYSRRQVELAREHAGSQMIWLPRDLEIEKIEDERHQRLLQGLERGEGRGRSCDFVRASPVDLTRLIVERLAQLRSAVAVENAPAPRSCLLVTHAKDTAHMLPVAGALLERGVQPYIDQEANEPRALVQLFGERLREAASLIVFYGSVSASWVRERLDTAIQRAVTDGRTDLKLGVFAAPPDKAPETLQFSRGFVQVALLSNPADALSFVGVP